MLVPQTTTRRCVSNSEPQDSTVGTYYIGRPGEIARMVAESPKLTPEAAAEIRRLLDLTARPRPGSVKTSSEEEKTHGR